MICELCGIQRDLEHVCLDALKARVEWLEKTNFIRLRADLKEKELQLNEAKEIVDHWDDLGAVEALVLLDKLLKGKSKSPLSKGEIMGAHTPGPWKDGSMQFGAGWRCVVNLPGGRSIDIADPRDRKTDEEDKANAALIASAPDLLAERDNLKLQVERLSAQFRLYQERSEAGGKILFDRLEAENLKNEESLKLMSHLHSLLSLVRHRYLERGVDSLERDIDTLLGQSEKALGPFWKKQMQQNEKKE